jgi:DNA polymerase-4
LSAASAPVLCLTCCRMTPVDSGRCRVCGERRLIAHLELSDLSVAHIDCDAFYASVEKRDRPELAAEPLIIGHTGGRGVVVTACYLARPFGVRSAMPMYQAIERCPQATVLSPDMAKYKRVSEDIRAIFHALTPMVEPLSLDEAYLDLSDDHRLAEATAAEALAIIASRIEDEVGITVSVGLASNKFLAKLASDLRKPRGFSVIGRAEARQFLAPLPVGKIHGVGAVTARRMEENGFRTIADLQALSARELTARFGKFGQRLAQFVHGEDGRQVTPERPTKSISAETTFTTDTGSADELRAVAQRLSERVAGQLERKNLAGISVTVKLKTADFRLLTRSRRLAHPTQRADVIFESAAGLIDREADGRRFRLIGIGVSELCGATAADPNDLFTIAASPGGKEGVAP